ncbi:VWA domain-containing protein [Phaeacidiphilus oryzae]|uniref:VWA domain-containing protein n=1 Tax=Phaeacidiphilus oryzae TaxID=348818 RepID=UPI00055C88B9|nr:VWA domain-containing protein [Phaeacidiphilus oryzae]
MPAHIHLDPGAGPAAPSSTAAAAAEDAIARWADDGGAPAPERTVDAEAHWLRVSAALTARLPELTGREDLVVTCRPGTESGAPAAFFPTRAAIEVDGTLFRPHPPAALRPDQHGDEERYPAAWGALVHEAAHAVHSRWVPAPCERGSRAAEAAGLLEESRIEKRHLNRRPQDRRWLRASLHRIVLADLGPALPDTPHSAARLATLVLARTDAGILDEAETAPVRRVVEDVLDPELLARLAALWNRAHTLADEDGAAMLDLGRQWCDLLGPLPTPPGTAPGAPRRPGLGDDASAPTSSRPTGGRLADSLSDLGGEIAADEKARAARSARTRDCAAQAAEQRRAADLAKKVFDSARGTHPINAHTGAEGPRSPLRGTRPPTTAERAAAGKLARALRAAAYRERTETTLTCATPPGRLRMRAALARDAQRAAGAAPTAEPFTRTVRRSVPSPPLRVGIAVDVSGSMARATAPMASATWILARATALTDPDSRTAALTYDAHLTAVTRPGHHPAQVTEFRARGNVERLAAATSVLTAALDLDQPGAGRLLVIATDGHYTREETQAARARLAALSATGCAVLHLAFAPAATRFPGVPLAILRNPDRAVDIICRAATLAITTTQ